MIKGQCPTCRKPYEIEAMSALPTFPFCSERCRLLDLGRWFDGVYAIPEKEPHPAPPVDADGEEGE
jgi:endogenous inhibitor of DNA gyrase (YacG/DUF329 family)